MSVGQRAPAGSLTNQHKHLASSHGVLQFTFGKGQEQPIRAEFGLKPGFQPTTVANMPSKFLTL